MTRPLKLALLAVAVTILIGGGIVGLQSALGPKPATPEGGVVSAVPLGGPFTLTDHNGDTVTQEDFRGRFALIYFGYTFCPDVCPTELGQVAAALDILGAAGDKVTPVLITIDPERDTAEVLAEYVPLFHERLVGLTGTPQQIHDAAAAYRVFYRKVENPDYTYYLMDHSSFTYLLGPEGSVVSLFRYGTPAEEMAAAIRRFIEG